MDNNTILHVAATAGRIILQNGGETYRVEETMTRICIAFGISETDSFVTPTGIMISITDKDGKTSSLVKRIHYRTVNLEKIDKVNSLSRNILLKNMSMDVVKDELKRIENLKSYNDRVLLFCSSIAAGFFTLLFGGTLKDFLVSCIIGVAIRYLSTIFDRIKLNSFFINIVGGGTAALIGLIAHTLNLCDNVDKLIIGSIMLLVPGLIITNAIRDTIAGDLVSGISRALEAFFIAVGIAVGTGIVFKIWFILFGGISL